MDPDVHSTRATLTAKGEVLPTKEKNSNVCGEKSQA